MSFPSEWTALDGMKDSEETDTARYHALGNAVTPPVAEWLAKRMHSYLVQADSEEQAATPAAATA
jgi:DNA (cytosine-5)-methyltransferase 1